MNRFFVRLSVCGLIALGTTGTLRADPVPPTKPTAGAEKEVPAEVMDAYKKLVNLYLQGNRVPLAEELKNSSKFAYRLPLDLRKNIDWIRQVAPEQRPAWWVNTKSPSKTRFPAQIFGKAIDVNYIPDDMFGVQMPVDYDQHTKRLVYIVSWRPTQVDNPRAADGWMAKRMSLSKGDIGEVVVWHELGHYFLSSCLSTRDTLELYRNHQILYSTLQEFFADISALYHSSPKARLCAMLLRTTGLAEEYNELEPHTRGSNAVGALFLAEVLSNPAKWPSVHLPAKVPDADTELETIIYVYENIDPNWTLEEDRQLREFASNVVRIGDRIFSSKGMIPLASKLPFSLMEAQDRENQVKRNTWVAEQLKKAVADGRADKDGGVRPERDRPHHKGWPDDWRIELPNY